MSLGENIKKCRKKAGLTQLSLAQKANISRSYLADVEGNRYNMSLDVLNKIAKALNVDVSELLDENREISNFKLEYGNKLDAFFSVLKLLTDDDGFFIRNIQEDLYKKVIKNIWMGPAFPYSHSGSPKDLNERLDEFYEEPDQYSESNMEEILEDFNQFYNYRTVKECVLKDDWIDLEEMTEQLEEIIKKHNLNVQTNFKQIRVPVLGSVAAGYPIERIEYIEGYELVESETIRGRDAFCLKVKGDSMIGDGIFNGDTVVVVVQPEVSSSDIAVVSVNYEEATLKRVKCENEMCMLIPSNPAMQPKLVSSKHIKVLGKVIQVRRNFE